MTQSKRFAARTKVPVSTSRNEIETTLKRYGADAFAYGSDKGRAMVAFRAHGRFLKMTMPIPPGSGNQDTQEARQRWRALLLVIKAKLEAVASGIVTFDQEFLPWVVLPDGSTVSDWAEPQLKLAYEKGEMPTALLEHFK